MKTFKEAKYAYLLTVVYLVLWIAGCATQSSQPSVVEDAGLGLSDKATTIKTATANIKTLAPQPAVKVETNKIDVVAESLNKDDERVRELQAKIAQAESASEQRYQEYLSWALLCGGVCLLGGLALLAISIKLSFLSHYGLIASVFGVVVVSVSRFLATNDWGIIAVGAVCMLSLIGYGAYFFVKALNKKQVFVQETADLKIALIDALKTTELLKSKARSAWEDILPSVKKLQNPTSTGIIRELKRTEINNPV